MAERNQTVKMLQVSVDELDESYFRFLVDDRFVKYVTVAPGLYTAEDMCFAPVIIPLLPEFPAGDWNDGYVDRHPEHSTAHFARATRKHLQGVRSVWHPTSVDHLEILFGDKFMSGVFEATSARFQGQVVVKYARFEWEVEQMERETRAYEWIKELKIGPRFLGHLMEEGRAIGFVLEAIMHARHATLEDLEACRKALSALHQHGILHEDTNKHNFLIRDGEATLIDFESARKETDSSKLEEEMDSLPVQLCDMSGRGGSYVVVDEA